MMSLSSRSLVVAVACILAGCEGTLRANGPDAGTARLDAAPVDAPPTDAPRADGLTPVDAAAIDMTLLDSGESDFGSADLGPPDLGPPDLGPPDLGPPDLGPPVDAGPYEASVAHTVRPIGYMEAPQGFWEYLPPDYTASGGTGSPLLLFFHGLGENGDGSAAALDQVLNTGPPRFIDRDEWPRERPFVVLSPQQRSGCPNAAGIAAFLTWARAHYNVDSTRIYLTGLSCGAIGISSYLRANALTTDVAAVVGISGDWRGSWSTHMCALGRVPIWAVHGDADTNGGTLSDFSRLPITDLIACPAPPREDAVLTMLPGVGHSGAAWNDTYSGAIGLDVFAWMLEHTRP